MFAIITTLLLRRQNTQIPANPTIAELLLKLEVAICYQLRALNLKKY